MGPLDEDRVQRVLAPDRRQSLPGQRLPRRRRADRHRLVEQPVACQRRLVAVAPGQPPPELQEAAPVLRVAPERRAAAVGLEAAGRHVQAQDQRDAGLAGPGQVPVDPGQPLLAQREGAAPVLQQGVVEVEADRVHPQPAQEPVVVRAVVVHRRRREVGPDVVAEADPLQDHPAPLAVHQVAPGGVEEGVGPGRARRRGRRGRGGWRELRRGASGEQGEGDRPGRARKRAGGVGRGGARGAWRVHAGSIPEGERRPGGGRG